MNSFWQSYIAGLASGVTLTVLTYVITYIIRKRREEPKSQNDAVIKLATLKFWRSLIPILAGLVLVIINAFYPEQPWISLPAVMLLMWGGMSFLMS